MNIMKNQHWMVKAVMLVAVGAAASGFGETLFFAGDSTLHSREYLKAKPYPAEEKCLGSWCDELTPWLKPGVKIVNLAMSGRSTKSFIDEGRWGKLIAQVKPGDFVYIQFGHNDQKSNKPKVYAPSQGAFRENLRRFSAEVRQQGGTPVFGTPMVRRVFRNAQSQEVADGLEDYPDAVRDEGRKLSVEVVDFNAFTKKMVSEADRQESLWWYRAILNQTDLTHLTRYGAKIMAKAFYDEIKRRGIPLAALFRDQAIESESFRAECERAREVVRGFIKDHLRTGNLLRDDFVPDNWGGFVGWSSTSRGTIRTQVKLLDDRSPNDKPAIRLESVELYDNSGRDGVEIMPSKPLQLVEGATYQASVYVRTKGLKQGDSFVFILHGRPWDDKAIQKRLPLDTNGEWVKLELSGIFKSSRHIPEAYLSVYAGRGLGKGAYIDIAEPTLVGPTVGSDPADDLWLEKPQVRRVTPVDPLLDRMSAENAKMLFYYPGEIKENGEPLAVRATMRDAVKTVRLGSDHRALVNFGAVEPGAVTLKAELVGMTSGKVYAANEYRARVRAAVLNPTPIRRLNNFVGELFNQPLAEGEYEFTLAEEGWIYIGFSKALAGAGATVDGKEGVVYRPEERSETMRFLEPGRHVIKVTGVPPGTDAKLAIRKVCSILRQALHTALKKNHNFDQYYYGRDYWRRTGLFNGFNATSFTSRWATEPTLQPILDEMKRRGVSVEFGYGFGSTDVRRLKYDQYLQVVTNNAAYQQRRLVQFDENSFLPHTGAMDKVNTTEIWWRAYDEGIQMNVFLDDAGTAFYSNPSYDIPELAAYLNSGNGRGMIYGEAYFRSVRTRAELDSYLDLLRAQVKAMRYTNPNGPSHFSYLLCGWTMMGGWSPWYNTECDMRAMLCEMMRTFATDPEFADFGGISFSFPACWEDFWRFVSSGITRYYCIEGGTGDYAAINGMELFPKHIQNGDFLNGFNGWQVAAAETNSVRLGSKPKGEMGRVQGRVYMPAYRAKNKVIAGDTFAELTRSAKGPNRVSQKLVGLEPGRVYQVAYTAANLATVDEFIKEKPNKRHFHSKRPIVLEAEVKGAEVITDLCHTFIDFEKYAYGLNRTSRVVFRATSSEAEVVFSDWKTPTAPGAAIGEKTIFNAVMVHPYFYEDEAQLEVLKDLFRQAHQAK